MLWYIEIKDKRGVFDAIGFGVKKDIIDLGIHSVEDVKFYQVYLIDADVSLRRIRNIAEEILVDGITQEYSIRNSVSHPVEKLDTHVVEVAYNPGVMDPWEESIKKAVSDMGIAIKDVKTAKKYLIKGEISKEELKFISDKLLYNKLIQKTVTGSISQHKTQSEGLFYRMNLKVIPLLDANSDELLKLSRQGQLFLNLGEMFQIQKYFRKIKRNPTDCELETLAQTWSEHCKHKTFRGRIRYKERPLGKPEKSKLINDLLKTTIMKVTRDLRKPWCVSVFSDNSGVIRFDKEHNICFKVETHNHPSALEPYGGANTGIGGVIRDPLGTGLGAKPVLNTDVFCFGPVDMPFNKLPKGVLHPKRIMKGVVAGVRDYGNKMGIPTVNGAVLFDERYIGNPLVYCGTAGIMPKDKSHKSVSCGDLIVLVGGKTGRDGIHGATFSSGELSTESEVVSSSSVQIGNPIQEKKILDTILEAQEKNLYKAITDCGGGGLSSAVGEMAKDLGCRVDLEQVPLKYHGLSYTEIWISESQERMILAVSSKDKDSLLEIFSREDVEAMVIGEFTSDKHLKLFYKERLVCSLDMNFLHGGLPKVTKDAAWIQKRHKEPKFACMRNLTSHLKRILASGNVCSKEWIIRQYDHEVQGGSVLKPLVGKNCDSPSDAAVVRPLLDSKKAIVVSCGINPKYGLIDPYWMAGSCIDEVLRQITAVGGSFEKVAILDNFCWGNPDRKEQLGSLVRASLGCYDIAKKYGVPFISGKDSLNNEYKIKNRYISIPGTLLISGIGIIDDISRVVSMDLKQPQNLIYCVGLTLDELGGSHYYDLFGLVGNNVPQVDAARGKKIMKALYEAIKMRLISAMHDCSEGGIGVSCSEMAFAGDYGMEIFLSELPCEISKSRKRNDTILFSESNTRFIVEVKKQGIKEFERIFKNLPLGLIGCVSNKKYFKVYGLDGKVCINAHISDLKESWQKTLRW